MWRESMTRRSPRPIDRGTLMTAGQEREGGLRVSWMLVVTAMQVRHRMAEGIHDVLQISATINSREGG